MRSAQDTQVELDFLVTADRPYDLVLQHAEQLGLEEGLRNSSTVHRDEGCVAAPAVIVDGPRDELLARATFPDEKDRCVGIRDRADLVKDALQGGGAPDDVFESVALLHDRSESPVLLTQVAVFDRAAHGEGGLVHLEWFREVVEGAVADRKSTRLNSSH